MIKILLILLLIVFVVYAIWYYSIRRKAKEHAIPIEQQPGHQWTTEFLESKRQRTDPLADNVVDQIMERHQQGEINRLFSIIVQDDGTLPPDLPPEVRDYFEKTADLPPWADKDLMALGQQMYIRHGVLIGVLLSFKSLPECYACAKGAMVLYMTGRLNEHNGSYNAFSRRIAETAEFVMYTMLPGGLSPRGRGIRAAQKVRLIHAVIRYYLRQHNWDATQYDEPINQEDMAGTLMAFSALILEGLELINVQLNDAEKEAYMHCWRIIGYLMGVDEDLLPNNAADGLALGHAILKHQAAPSEQGNVLMAALLGFIQTLSPSFIDPQTNVEMMRFTMGNELADLLGVPPASQPDIDKLAGRVRLVAEVGEVLDHTLLLAMLIQGVSRLLLEAQIKYMDPNGRLDFYLPESLTKSWGFAQPERS
ncbi:oxygenase MpaB family protein [Spirosoma sp.]|uniref:oxygenase MpaB family protein n=1 Tax=Spirosoma sp. TaxID=1899569 RepID=UPI003B3A9563